MKTTLTQNPRDLEQQVILHHTDSPGKLHVTPNDPKEGLWLVEWLGRIEECCGLIVVSVIGSLTEKKS
jgi:hypothetical protein